MSSEKRTRMARADLLVDRNVQHMSRLMALDGHIIVIT